MIAYRTESPTHGLIVFTTWNEFAAWVDEHAATVTLKPTAKNTSWAAVADVDGLHWTASHDPGSKTRTVGK